MTFSRLSAVTRRSAVPCLLVLCLVLSPLAAFGQPAEGPAARSGAWSIWQAIAALFELPDAESQHPTPAVETKCGVIPDPSGICKNLPQPWPQGEREPVVRRVSR